MIRLATETDPTYEPYSNICPITGWDNALIDWHGSRNLVSGFLPEGSIGPNGVVNGSGQFSVYYARVRKGQRYTLVSMDGQAVYGYLDSDTVAIGSSFCAAYPNRFVEGMVTDTVRHCTITAPITGWIAWRTTHGDMTGAFYAGDSVQDYDAAQPRMIAVSLKQGGNTETVYGGTLTVNEDGSAELRVDHRLWTADGSVAWTKGADDNSWSATAGYNNDASTTGTGWCNYFRYVASWSSTGTMFAASNRIFIASGNPWNALSEVQAAFAETPLQVVYPLAVPLVYTFTAEQMATFLGVNNVSADCGAVTLTYVRDLATVIQSLEAAISALTPTTTEATETE